MPRNHTLTDSENSMDRSAQYHDFQNQDSLQGIENEVDDEVSAEESEGHSFSSHSPRTQHTFESETKQRTTNPGRDHTSEILSTHSSSIERFSERRLTQQDLFKKLNEESIKLKELEVRWKDTVRELNEIQAQKQMVNQVTDDYLGKKAEQLRYDIQTFAIQYFEDQEPASSRRDETTTLQQKLVKYPGSQSVVIEAWLWEFFSEKVFGNFCWAGKSSEALRNLTGSLNPSHQNSFHQPVSKAEQRYQVWRATTMELRLDVPDTKSDLDVCSETKEHIRDEIKKKLEPWLKSGTPDISRHLSEIIDKAEALDKDMSCQVAHVYFDFPDLQGKGLTPAGETLLSAPALVRKGNSSGKAYDPKEIVLLPAKYTQIVARELDRESRVVSKSNQNEFG